GALDCDYSNPHVGCFSHHRSSHYCYPGRHYRSTVTAHLPRGHAFAGFYADYASLCIPDSSHSLFWNWFGLSYFCNRNFLYATSYSSNYSRYASASQGPYYSCFYLWFITPPKVIQVPIAFGPFNYYGGGYPNHCVGPLDGRHCRHDL